MSRCLREGAGRGTGRCAGGRQVVSAPERTDGPELPAPRLRFGKAAVLRLREDRGRAPPIPVEANLGALPGPPEKWLAMGTAVCPPPLQGEGPPGRRMLTFVAQTSAP